MKTSNFTPKKTTIMDNLDYKVLSALLRLKDKMWMAGPQLNRKITLRELGYRLV